MSQQLSTNTFVVAKWVVSADATQGTHTTIQAAITASSSGDVIWIREGTYTENLSLKFGVQLRGCGPGPVGITGKMTMPTSGSGTCRFTDLLFSTNTDNIIVSTGSNVAAATFRNCIFAINDATGISQANSNGASGYEFFQCDFRLTDGQAVFAGSGGNFFFEDAQCFPTGVGGSTASTISAGTVTIRNGRFVNPITSSGTGSVVMDHSVIDCSGANATCLTIGGSGNGTSQHSTYSSGSASAISISTTLSSSGDVVSSTNTNAITGAGTLVYADVTFSNTSSVINTTTLTPRNTMVGRLILGTGVLSTGAAQVMSGTGDPNAAVTAPQGSLFLRLDGSSTSTRAYINTNSGTAWTSVTTAT